MGAEDRKDNILEKLWEEIVGAAGVIFRNQSKDQVATKIPFEGDLSNPDVQTWTAIMEILRNAFIQALFPSVDNEINIASVGGGKDKSELQKAYEKDKPKEKEKKKKDKKDEKSKKQ